MATGVRIVTDSQVCLPWELIQRHPLLISPITLVVDGREYRDGVDITPEEFYIEGGELKLLARARTRQRAVARLLQIMGQEVSNNPVHVIVSYANVPGAGEGLLAEVRSRFRCLESYLTEFTPVMGTHTGPGVLSLGFYPEAGPGD